eukprot:GEMP01000030.1.p1 GENE.GEMP01000030.1~~GEMP01000030.1.p1  ORF type:complete len:4608 (+),score=1069.56 GEMP01000030.1:10-13833(+)
MTLPDATLSKSYSKAQSRIRKSPSEIIRERQSSSLVAPVTVRDQMPEIVELLNMSLFSHHTTSAVSVDEPLFVPTPSLVEFRDFEGLQTYDLTLYLRNQDTVARRVKIIAPDSGFFDILPGKGSKRSSGDLVAPGMEVPYTVRFKPDAKIDYNYDIIVVTEREKFIVPIRAVGGSAILDFPDVVDFANVAVKYEETKTVLIRNIGDKATKFLLKTSPPFSTSILEGFLEVNGALQVDILFKPDKAESYERELYLRYADNAEAIVTLAGTGENVDVFFSHRFLNLGDTYIALSTRQVTTIENRSEVPIDFSWRAFATIDDELEQKMKLQVQLKREESDEQALLTYDIEDDSEAVSTNNSSVEDGDPDSRESRAKERALGACQRKYQNISKAVMDDPMFFYDDIFSIEPLSGRIWSKSKCQITISFTPKAALNYQCTGFCSVVGSSDRVPIVLKGRGIGPKAAFSYDELDVGDVFVESAHHYEVDLLNQGDIAVKFQLVQNNSPFASQFRFSPNEGYLEVGGQHTITVDFCPDLLGDFQETFNWDLVGSASQIPITFKGHIQAPTFHFDVERINFGTISYGFLNSKTLSLTNTSEVAMRFSIRIPGDGRFLQKEFDVIPSNGTLLPNCSIKVQIDFTSVNVKTYELSLVVDLDGVGQELCTVPITARCAVPMVSFFPTDNLIYDDIFIRYPFHQTLTLHNTSALPAKFEILGQDDPSKVLAEFDADQMVGSVPPASSHMITVTLTTNKIGSIRIPFYIRILGHNVPYPITLTANSIGPRVLVEPPHLDWGSVKCLNPVMKYVKLINDSCIDASVRAFMKSKNSLWSINPKVIHLSPQETIQLSLTLTVDETCRHTDVMHLVVHEGTDLTVNVKARGTETPVICKESLELINFGTCYTTQTIMKEFTIENHGRKTRKLVWASEKDDKGKKKEEEADQTGKGGLPLDVKVFSVFPDNIVLEGKSAYRFQVTAMCPRPGQISEILQCTELVGSDRSGKVVFKTEMCGDFVAPLLQLSSTTLHFKYFWERDVPIEMMTKELRMTNVSPLDIKFWLKLQPPFLLDQEVVSLTPSESTTVVVQFDPGFKSDKVCGSVRQKLQLVYEDHPQKDQIDLLGDVAFPNMELDMNYLDFGSVLNLTSNKMNITMSNPNALPVDFQWIFIEPDDDKPEEDEELRQHLPRGGFYLDDVSVNQVFDICPKDGRLQPGESLQVGFDYFGLSDRKVMAQAACTVDGGPEYHVTMRGQASRLEFKLDRTELDFGDIPFTQTVEKDLFISNPGSVACYFNVNLTTLNRPNVVDAQPTAGLIYPDQKQKITVKFCPGVPDLVEEFTLVEVAHFEPTRFRLSGRGIFPGIVLSLPRSDTEAHERRLDLARAKRAQKPAELCSPSVSRPGSETHSSAPSNRSTPRDERSTANPLVSAHLDLEFEVDRAYLCEVLLRKEEEALLNRLQAPSPTRTAQSMGKKKMKGDNQMVTAGSYVCDFGNIVLGHSRKKFFCIHNCYHEPVSFTINRKLLAEYGYTVEPQQVKKLPPHDSMQLSVSAFRHKDGVEGRQELEWNLPIKGGCNYTVNLVATFVLPDLTLSSDAIDFGRVIVGQRKRITMQLNNTKSVPVEWTYKEPRNKFGKPLPPWEVIFDINPKQGTLNSGESVRVEVSFTPNASQHFGEKLALRMRDNQNKKLIHFTGYGDILRVEVPSLVYELGPVLPYDDKCTKEIVLVNPTDYPIEVYSIEFDDVFRREEEMLRAYKFDEYNLCELPTRDTGERTWKEVVKCWEHEETVRIARENGEEPPDEEREEEEDDRGDDADEALYPYRVPTEDRLNVLLIGPRLTAKTSICKALVTESKRKLIRVDEVLEWALSVPTVLKKDKVAMEIVDRIRGVEGTTEVEAREPQSWTKEDVAYVFQKRIQMCDCNCGVVVDSLQNQALGPEDTLTVLFGIEEKWRVCVVKPYATSPKAKQQPSSDDVAGTEEADATAAADETTARVAEEEEEEPPPLAPHELLRKFYDDKATSLEQEQEEEEEEEAPQDDGGESDEDENAEEKAEKRRQLAEERAEERRQRALQRTETAAMMREVNAEKEIDELTTLEELLDTLVEDINKEYLALLEKRFTPTNKSKRKQMQFMAQAVPDDTARPAEDHPAELISRQQITLEQDIAIPAVPVPLVPSQRPLPPPTFSRLVSRPMIRPHITRPECFSVLTPVVNEEPPKEEENVGEDSGEGVADAEPAKVDKEIEYTTQTRWVLPPHTEKKLILKFFSKQVNTFSAMLSFEVVGGVNITPISVSVTGITAFPNINSDPRNVFMRRVKARGPTGYANRQYVASLNLYDFGPLIANRDPEQRHGMTEKAPPDDAETMPRPDSEGKSATKPVIAPSVLKHCETFRLTNNSLFQATVNIALGSSRLAVANAKVSSKAKAARDGNADPAGLSEEVPSAPFADYPFLIDCPMPLILEREQTAEVKVWCFPVREGQFTDSVVCTVLHNPEAITFPIAAIGSLPHVEIDSNELNFDRLLLHQKDSRKLKLTNTSAIPVLWSLKFDGDEETQEGMPEDFSVEPMDGMLGVGEERGVLMTFKATKTEIYKFGFMLNCTDVEGLGVQEKPRRIVVSAESFEVDVSIEFGNERGLDFGAIRVGQTAEQTFDIVNNGKYPIRYEFIIRKKLIRELLNVEHTGKDLGPGERRSILVKCSSSRELKIVEGPELFLNIFEAKSGERVEPLLPPIKVSVQSVFNQFSITPPRGLNFGPVRNGETKHRTFEIKNEGVFPFKWALFDASAPFPGNPGEEVPSELLRIGPYTVNPAGGTLKADNSTVNIEVKFEAVDDRDYDCKIYAWVDGIEPTGSAAQGCMVYLLTGQSCIPGIDTKNDQWIFEEQFVTRTQEDAIATAGRNDIRVFCQQDRVFNFGPILAQGPDGGKNSGITEKFRIINPKAISCEVKFEVKPKVVKSDLPFEVSPQSLTIPAHEHRYVSLSFRPPFLQTYNGIFEASVVDGIDPLTNFLTFELHGDGTVPSISIEGPMTFLQEGVGMQFGKLQLGYRPRSVEIQLRNDGIVPATARIDAQQTRHFSIACTSSIPLEPKETHRFRVTFQPKSEGEFTSNLRIYTLYNPFEDTTFKLMGEGYIDDVSWDFQDVPIPVESEPMSPRGPILPVPDELNLGEVALGCDAEVTFFVTNNANKPIRFEFPNTLPGPLEGSLTISPSVGHLAPNSRKPIFFCFRPKEKALIDNLPIPCTIATIAYTEEAEDWDDTMKIVQFQPKEKEGEEGATAAEGEVEGEVEQEEVEVVKPEPPHAVVEDTTRDMPLKVRAIVDARSYECSVNEVRFAPTMMFHAKLFRFTVKNTSTISMPFNWRFIMEDGKSAQELGYMLTPKTGVVPAAQTQEFVVRFSPTEVENFNGTAECDISDLSDACTPLSFPVFATAIRPVCHFELPSSDYRERREGTIDPIDPKCMIIEFPPSLGTKIKNTKRFYVLNPTAEPYDFVWVPDEDATEDCFRCITKRGTIHGGKKFEIVFEYVPLSVGTHEMMWNFTIVGKNVEQQFLVVGSVKEPRIGFDQPCINFGRLLLGGRSRETLRLVNKEHIPFSFNFQKESYCKEGAVPTLYITPTHGVVGPDASFPIECVFKPNEENTFSYNVVCHVKSKADPLVMKLKGEGYKIHATLTMQDAFTKRAVRTLHPGITETLDFGTLQVHEKRAFTLVLSNQGSFNFDYVWVKPTRSVPQKGNRLAPYVTVTSIQGVAKQKEEVEMTLEYCPSDTHCLDNHHVKLLIPSGPGESAYLIELMGRARRPQLDFSFTNYDFGPCFVKKGTMSAGEPSSPQNASKQPYSHVDLIVTNRDQHDCILSTSFLRLPYLDVQMNTTMIEAGQSLTVPIIFTPRDYIEYRERIEFMINDVTKSYVNLRGRGTPMHLELVSMEMQNVDFGVTTGNQSVSRSVRVVNKSARSVTFTLTDPDDSLKERQVSWSPSLPVTLRPKEQLNVDMHFSPNFRVATFKLPLFAKCGGELLRLLVVSGTCHATEIKLSEHSLLFGSVVVNSTVQKAVHLHNFGDLGSKFRFDLPAKYNDVFTIEPGEGHVAPHDDIILTVSFHPKQVTSKAQIVANVRCLLDNHEPVKLMIQGGCIAQPEDSIHTLVFDTEVRQEQKQTLMFPPKPTHAVQWKVHPIVRTDDPSGSNFWFCSSDVTVPPNAQAQIEVSYKPLLMTQPDQKHTGSIFIATPDGSAFVYQLEGVASEPTVDQTLDVEIPCKTAHVQSVPIQNWLHVKQRFDVVIEMLEPAPDSEEAKGIKIQGVETFDLPPSQKRDYKFNAYAYKEGTNCKLKLTFMSNKLAAIKEFLCVTVNFKFQEPKNLGTLVFDTSCRQNVRQQILLANPLSTPVTFACQSEHPDFMFSPDPLIVQPESEVLLEVNFRPVLEGDGESRLSLSSPSLGTYPYLAKYKVRPPALEKTLVFKVPLGQDVVEMFRFHHLAKKPATYTVKVDAAPGHKEVRDFTVETKDIKAVAADKEPVEVSIGIRFAPSQQAECRALLCLSSPEGGEFRALLVGYAQAPQPQGPVVIQTGKQGTTNFRNPFHEAVEFFFRVDNSNFSVGSPPVQKLDPQKVVQINVNFKGDKPMGSRLIVTCDLVTTPWIFFLKGTM